MYGNAVQHAAHLVARDGTECRRGGLTIVSWSSSGGAITCRPPTCGKDVARRASNRRMRELAIHEVTMILRKPPAAAGFVSRRVE